ncbi:MAG: alpha/beta hydrolase-fold protein [Myxococcota bacterium]|nr:alpha/beta hydrolase-fold protein [Myxococcota bacterium]
MTTESRTWGPLGAVLFSLVGCGAAAPAPALPADSGGGNAPVDAATQPVADNAADAGDHDGASLTPQAAALVASRPYTIHVPPGYDPARPAPLLLMLHGYSANGQIEEDAIFHFNSASDTYGFLYAVPNGTVDSMGNRFWNATDVCCNFYGSNVDDVAYLNAVIDDVESRYTVDRKQVFVGGHSNGAMMAQVLACRASERIAAVYSYAGAVWTNPSFCVPKGPVSLVELHGDRDSTVPYDGGSNPSFPQSPAYPSANGTVTTWASRDGCTGSLMDDGETFDFVASLPGNETTVAKAGGCPPGIDAELWTIHGGGHVEALVSPAFGDALWRFLHGHSKP